MALINKHFEEVLDDIGVLKLWTTKFLGIPIFRKESLSERATEINAFQTNQRLPVGFKTNDKEEEETNEEIKDKSKSIMRQMQTGNNTKRRIHRLKSKR